MAPTPATPIVVDQLAIEPLPGYLGLRAAGTEHPAPVVLALPAPAARGMVDHLVELAHHADSDHAALTRIAGPDGARAVAATINAASLLADALRHDTYLALSTARGFVTITTFTPYTPAPAVLAVPPPLIITNTDALTLATSQATDLAGRDPIPPAQVLTDMTSWDWPPHY